ncbi:hypothetical protein BCR35DRAFT_298690 [Leucosporidium creatinivorum]|uniref:Coiled-coil domain-containing protein n=1 Tax=Leucosporidium creatinivorum TaxID=106004 RepID=A0A1Y2G3I5_9BASI|nr:hypothetical protein BCR35DRAFT_298690 [Leucosporidium creatinivorum]
MAKSKTSPTTKKTKSSKDKDDDKPKSAWHTYYSAKMTELKSEYPDMDGAERRAKACEIWKTHPDNPKRNK